MEAQAARLNASGIIGLHEICREIAPEVWELSVQGTAVQTGAARAKGERPFLPTFTGQDYFALTAAGVLGITVTTERTLCEGGRVNVGMTIEFTALRTAVVLLAEEAPTVTHSLYL